MIGAFFILPFLFTQSTKLLSLASLFSMISIMVFLFITFYDFTKNLGEGNLADYNILPDFSKLELTEAIIAFPSIFIAFLFQFNFFPILDNLNKPTNKRMLNAGYMGMSFVFLIYMLISTMGYMIYGDTINANYLITVQDSAIGKTLYILLQSCFVVVMLMSFPLLFYEPRNIFLYFIAYLFPSLRTGE